MRGPSVRCFWLATLLAAPLVCAQTSTDPTLTTEQVLARARAEVARSGYDLSRYTPDKPYYYREKGQWRVFFRQNSSAQIADGDVTAVVNDKSDKTCVGTMFVPPCT